MERNKIIPLRNQTILKRRLNGLVYLVPFSFLVFLNSSFSTDKDNAVLSEQINNVFISYSLLKPDTGFNVPNVPDSNKAGWPAEIQEMFDNGNINNYLKTEVLEKGTPLVGVLKASNAYSCGPYPQLDIFMDCEDDTRNSSTFGWTGASKVDNDKNVLLKFCIIDNGLLFKRTSVDYAVLRLNNIPLSGASIATLVITNEWDGNINYTVLYPPGSTGGTAIVGNFGPCTFTTSGYPEEHPCSGKNNSKPYYPTILSFFYFPADKPNWESFPNLSITQNYGVFGRFGPKQGYVYSDDQNNGQILCHKNNNNHWYVGSNLIDCVELEDATHGKNTMYYFSYINNIDCYLNP